MPPLTAAEIIAHPAFQHLEWDLPPTTSGLASVASGRAGGPFDLYYQIHGTGERRLVWIMGLGAFYTAWKRQTLHFGQKHGSTYSSLVFDNRGMGRSGKPLCRYSTSEMALDLIDLLRHLGWLDDQDKASDGEEIQKNNDNNNSNKKTRRKIHIIGVSMGGMIAQELALLLPAGTIGSLCLVSTAPRLIRTIPFLQNLKERALMFIPRDRDVELAGVAHRLFADDFLALPDTENEELGVPREGRVFPCNQDRVAAGELKKKMDAEAFTKKGFMLQAVAAGWHAKSGEDLKRLADRVDRRRILVMHGTADGMLVFKHGEVLVEELNAGVGDSEGTVEFRVWKNAGHVLPWERRDEFNAAVEKLVDRGEQMG